MKEAGVPNGAMQSNQRNEALAGRHNDHTVRNPEARHGTVVKAGVVGHADLPRRAGWT